MTDRTLTTAASLALAFLVTGPQVVAAQSSLSEDEMCLVGIRSDTDNGPFDYDTRTQGRVKMWVPEVPTGCRVPVIHLANGTGATCSFYDDVIRSLASHGFLTVCYESTNTGAGTQGIEAIETARDLYPSLVSNKIGSMGHSQGGQAAFIVLALAEDEWGPSFTYAGLAMQPASGYGEQPRLRRWQSVYATIESPMFMFSGTADVLVSERWVQRGFDALDSSVEAYNWSRSGSTHIPVPNAETVEVGVPWFRWKLLGDQDACARFQELRDSRAWSVSDEQNAVGCTDGEEGAGITWPGLGR